MISKGQFSSTSFLLISFLLLFPIFGNAQNTSFTRSSEGNVYATNSSCLQLGELARDLEMLTRSRNEPCSPLQPLQEDDLCRMNISRCLPRQIEALHEAIPEVNGPNCFNAALVYSGILPALRMSHANEMGFYLRSPLCRKLDRAAAPSPGDIGVVKHLGVGDTDCPRDGLGSGGSGCLKHAFVHISNDVIYTKHNFSAEGPDGTPFALQSPEGTYIDYGGPNRCPEPVRSVPERQRVLGCVDYYRCESLTEFLARTRIAEPIRNAVFAANTVERCIELVTMQRGPFSDAQSRQFLESLRAMTGLLNDARATTEYERFVISALTARVVGTGEQSFFFTHANATRGGVSVVDRGFPYQAYLENYRRILEENLPRYSPRR